MKFGGSTNFNSNEEQNLMATPGTGEDEKKEPEQGRAIAQEVSRRLPTAAARVQTRVWSCGIF
jgi:hypothetical protein